MLKAEPPSALRSCQLGKVLLSTSRSDQGSLVGNKYLSDASPLRAIVHDELDHTRINLYTSVSDRHRCISSISSTFPMIVQS
jgi:hypothetical protein